jgi:hypothetical protein
MALRNMRPRTLITAGSATLMAFALLATPAATLAQGGGGGVTNPGTCTAASTTKIKAKHDNGRIEVEFEVDQNVIGKTWNVKLFHNGDRFFMGQRTTQAPSGSFTVRKLTGNRAGTDTLKGRARNPQTGEVCIATVSI